MLFTFFYAVVCSQQLRHGVKEWTFDFDFYDQKKKLCRQMGSGNSRIVIMIKISCIVHCRIAS